MSVRWLAMIAIVLACVLAGETRAQLTSQQRVDVLLEAQQEYDRAIALLRADPEEAKRRFRLAADRFQVLVDDGVLNGRLFYNLANARFQGGQLGLAILNYRRAEQLIAGDGRVESNLASARSLVRSRIPPSGQRALAGALLGWHEGTSLSARLAAFTLAYLLFWATLLALRFRPGLLLRYVAGIGLLVAAATGTSVVADAYLPADRDAGVIVVDDVVVRKGNGDGFEPKFEEPLYQGVEFELIERRAGWLNIRLPNDETGWIRESQAGMVM